MADAADSNDSASDDDDAPAARLANPIAHLLQAAVGGAESDSDDEDAAAAAPTPAPAAASSAPTNAAPAAEADDAPRGGGLLPTPDELLQAGSAQPDFLRVEKPDFDASAGFKPPTDELLPAVGHSLARGFASQPPPRGWRGDREFARADHDQRHAREQMELGEGRNPANDVRLRGSICRETDDERGRRVKYGAHAMLSANPWSACNPKYNMEKGAAASHLGAMPNRNRQRSGVDGGGDGKRQKR